MKQFDRGKRVSNELGDFTTTPRLLKVSALALGIGAVSAFVALGLLKLIALFTNIFFYPNGSRVEPKLAILKPVSSAISIGSGGPFGAEGPIMDCEFISLLPDPGPLRNYRYRRPVRRLHHRHRGSDP